MRLTQKRGIFENLNKIHLIGPIKFEGFDRADSWFFLGKVRKPFLFYLKKKGFPVGQLISFLL
ncbi:MAG: hypothetical protein A2007_04815 [Verrucomicrobia bacterium GWC2_42_7]|nr:MAG: hypothetical protein A2007_04815 [Verrucomicrobia bacterium GWC2_42_7]